MRCLKRNKRAFWYCQYQSKTAQYDDYGNETSEPKINYSKAVKMYANISEALGVSNTERFGNLENYDKVIVTDDMNCPIDVNSVLFVDKAPEYSDQGGTMPKYDYIVQRVSKSLNSIAIAIKKVDVS